MGGQSHSVNEDMGMYLGPSKLGLRDPLLDICPSKQFTSMAVTSQNARMETSSHTWKVWQMVPLFAWFSFFFLVFP